jgi:phospholipase/lecithinase/hemolysin
MGSWNIRVCLPAPITLSRFCFPLAFLLLALAAPASAGPYTDLVVFGDSLSDVGNVWIITGESLPAPPYYNGRFSNGPVWVEKLAEMLELPPPTPSLLGGNASAWGGAETGGGFSHQGPPNLGLQVDAYLSVTDEQADPTALYVVWAGANDFLAGLEATPQTLDPTGWADNVADVVDTLHEAGAAAFLMPNLPPLGSTPRLRDHQAILDPAVRAFNDRLALRLRALENSHPDLEVETLDVYRLFHDVITDPASYGLENVTDAAMTTDGADPDKYLFWDDLHPTAAAHALLAHAVPEPSTLGGLFSGAAAVLLVYRRRRRRARCAAARPAPAAQ